MNLQMSQVPIGAGGSGADGNPPLERRPVGDQRVVFAFLAAEVKPGLFANFAQIGDGGVVQFASNPVFTQPAGFDAGKED